jgi:hypothetical protein
MKHQQSKHICQSWLKKQDYRLSSIMVLIKVKTMHRELASAPTRRPMHQVSQVRHNLLITADTVTITHVVIVAVIALKVIVNHAPLASNQDKS